MVVFDNMCIQVSYKTAEISTNFKLYLLSMQLVTCIFLYESRY